MIEYLILIIFCCLFGYLFWRKEILALAFIIFALPSYLIRFRIFNIPLTLLEIMILIIGFLFIIKKIKARDFQICFSNYKWLILLWLATATLAAFLSDNFIAALGVWKAYFIEPVILFFVFINVVKNKNDLEKIFIGIGWSAVIVSIFAIYQKFTGAFIFNKSWFDPATRRVTSFFGYPNAVGLYLAPIVVLFIGKLWLIIAEIFESAKKNLSRNTSIILLSFIINKKIRYQVAFYLLVISTSVLAIIFACSEGALIGAAIGVLFIGLLIKQLQIPTLIFLGLIIIFLMIFPTGMNFFIEKATLQDFSGKLRLIIWQETLQMLKDHLIFGGGLANYKAAIAPYHHAFHIFEIYPHSHQLFLNLWSELGLLGLCVFILLILKFIWNYFKVSQSLKQEYAILIAVVMTILSHGLVDMPYFKNDLSVMWWFLIAVSWLYVKNFDKK